MGGRGLCALLGGGLVALFMNNPARADLHLCNKTSYVLDFALALEDKSAVATRGWFRAEPGQCRAVLQGAIEADALYVHARSLPVYGASPLAQTGHAELCVADGNFVIAAARTCRARSGQRLVRFTAIKPAQTEQGLVANFAEEADYSLDQARLAAIQRLLVLGGYDANPIDGLEGKKTDAALAQFLKEASLSAEATKRADFLSVLADWVKSAEGVGFSWCNETRHVVMAALGVEEQGAVTTRGWYRVEPGQCMKPEMIGRPERLYSFAEVLGVEGEAFKRPEKTLVWGGTKPFCTRNVRFEIGDHTDCLGRGLNATGFATVDLTGRKGVTVRFRE